MVAPGYRASSPGWGGYPINPRRSRQHIRREQPHVPARWQTMGQRFAPPSPGIDLELGVLLRSREIGAGPRPWSDFALDARERLDSYLSKI